MDAQVLAHEEEEEAVVAVDGKVVAQKSTEHRIGSSPSGQAVIPGQMASTNLDYTHKIKKLPEATSSVAVEAMWEHLQIVLCQQVDHRRWGCHQARTLLSSLYSTNSIFPSLHYTQTPTSCP